MKQEDTVYVSSLATCLACIARYADILINMFVCFDNALKSKPNQLLYVTTLQICPFKNVIPCQVVFALTMTNDKRLFPISYLAIGQFNLKLI